MRQSIRIYGIAGLAATFFWMGISSALIGQTTRPLSEDLLPENTVAYIQIRDFQEFVIDMQGTNMGKMLASEKVAPLVDDLYGQAKDAFSDFEGEIGLAWNDIEQLPHGEICFAVVAPRRADTQFVLIMDVNPESEAINNVLGRIDSLVEENGGEIATETNEQEIEVKSVQGPEGRFYQFRIDNTIVISNDKKLADEIIMRWMNQPVDKVRKLSENRKFVTIMNRCRGTKDAPPELRFYADPIELVRSLTRGDAGTQLALNFLPLLGLDGLLAVGAASIFDEMEFESVTHMHLMLANPRAGIFEMLALKPADYQPEPWVSDETTNYISMSMDPPKIYAELTKIVDGFTGEGEFERQVEENINAELDLNFAEDVIGSLNGRVTLATWVEKTESVNANSNSFGIGLKDTEKALMVIEKIRERIERDNNSEEERLIENKYKDITYWSANVEGQRQRLEQMRDEGRMQVSVRAPEPCFGIIGETFVFCDNRGLMEKCIETFQGESKSLAENDDFIIVADRMNRMLGTDMPSGVFYAQPGPTIEWMLKLAKGEDAQGLLADGASENKYLGRLKEGLENNPIPDYEEVQDYFRPSGGFITSDDTGYHWLQFQMKANK